MRFNDRNYAILGIPDLPINAFKHIGDKKIKPQGGLDSFVGSIGDAIGGVVGGVSDALAGVDDAVNESIPGGWLTVGALAGGAALASGGLGGAAAGTTATGGTLAGMGTGAAGAATSSGLGSLGIGSLTGAAPSFLGSLGSVGSAIFDFAKANPSIAGSLLGAVTGAIGASNAPTSQTSTTSIDPQIKQEYLANLDRAKTTAAGLEARQFEGFTPSYLLAETQAQNLGLGGAGQQTTNQATRLAMIEAGFTPQQIQAATAGNASLANAQGYTAQQMAAANAGNASLANAQGYTAQQMAAAQANRGNVANVQSGAGSQYMAAYQNPYEEQVVQGALGDIERTRQMQEQANMAQATAARAFGGSRQGVVSGMTNEAALRQAATTGGQLRSAGFTQAAQLGQTDAARQLQAQLANQGIDVTLEQANAQLRQQGLLSNQAASNQAMQFGAGAINQANLTNAAAQNQMAQYNAQLAQQSGLSNQAALNQAAQFGAGATNQANLTNASALNQMAQFNAQMAQQAALANQGAFAQGSGIRQAAIGQLGQLGAQQQNLGLTGANAVMEAQMRQQALRQARLDAARNLGTERLAITGGALGLQPANVGQTSTQPLYTSQAGSLLSGGLTGAYIGSLLGK